MSRLAAVFGRELRLAARARADALQPLTFYLIVVALFPLGVAPADPSLVRYAPALVWVAALLSALLSLERVFRSDYDDGTLEQLLLSGTPTAWLMTAKLAAHWLLTGLPLTVAGPLFGLALGLSTDAAQTLFLSLLLGTPVLIFSGGFIAALTVSLNRTGVLTPILLLPLLTPVLVFGAGSVRAAEQGLNPAAPLYFLAAMLMLCLTLIPWATAAALRNAIEA